MKNRAGFVFVVVAVLTFAVIASWRRRPPAPVTPGHDYANASPAWTAARKPPVEVAIEEGKTIDFSSGRARVNDDAQQKSAIEKSVSEMDAAARSVTFAPRPAAAPAKP